MVLGLTLIVMLLVGLLLLAGVALVAVLVIRRHD